MMRTLFTGTAYVAAVFAAGFVLGVLRTLVLVPLWGELAAVLVELPLILTIAWLVCTRILRRWPLLPPSAVRMGAIAFLLLMLAEAALSTLLAGRSLAEHLALYSQWPGNWPSRCSPGFRRGVHGCRRAERSVDFRAMPGRAGARARGRGGRRSRPHARTRGRSVIGTMRTP